MLVIAPNLFHFPIGVVLKSNGNTLDWNRRSRCDSMWGCKHVLSFLYSQFCTILWETLVNIPLPGYRYIQKLTQLNLIHRYESYGIAPQLMPWPQKWRLNGFTVRKYHCNSQRTLYSLFDIISQRYLYSLFHSIFIHFIEFKELWM